MYVKLGKEYVGWEKVKERDNEIKINVRQEEINVDDNRQ
jgi:hypothetical protein